MTVWPRNVVIQHYVIHRHLEAARTGVGLRKIEEDDADRQRNAILRIAGWNRSSGAPTSAAVARGYCRAPTRRTGASLAPRRSRALVEAALRLRTLASHHGVAEGCGGRAWQQKAPDRSLCSLDRPPCRIYGAQLPEMQMTDQASNARRRERARRPSGTALAAAYNALPTLVLLCSFDGAVVLAGVIAARVYGVAFLCVVPGTVLNSLFRFRPRSASLRLAWAVATSLLSLMLLGLAYSFLLPHVGIAVPLRTWPVVAGVNVLTIGALVAQCRRQDPLEALLVGTRARAQDIAVMLSFYLLPLAAIAGAERLNNGAGSLVAVGALAASGVAIVVLFALIGRLPTWLTSSSLFAISLGTQLGTSMRSHFPFGYDIQTEYRVFDGTLKAGFWHLPYHGDPYQAMLSITILPTMLSVASHVTGTYLFKVTYTTVISLFPVLTFTIARRWFPGRAAYTGAVVVVVQGFFAADITGLARQEIGFLYFAVFVATAFDESIPLRSRKVAVVVAAAGMAISHYSTAYFALSAVGGGYLAYGIVRVLRRSWRPRVVFTLPVVLLTFGMVFLWNAGITRSASNLGGLVSAVETNGLSILPGGSGSSLIQRILAADVQPTVTAGQAADSATAYYRSHDPWIHPYASPVTSRYRIQPANVPDTVRDLPAAYTNYFNSTTTAVNELLLFLFGIGTLALLWRERRAERPELTELAWLSFACLVLLALLRFSATLSTLYNAPRGQAQGSPLLSVGLALACSWLFSRRWAIGGLLAGIAAILMAVLLFVDSGLSSYALGGSAADNLVNYGEGYQRFYITDADMATVDWLAGVYRPGDVLYADAYASIQVASVAALRGLVQDVIPPIIEPGAYVYADATNIVGDTARSSVANKFAVFKFPRRFFQTVKDTVFTTGTTEVYH